MRREDRRWEKKQIPLEEKKAANEQAKGGVAFAAGEWKGVKRERPREKNRKAREWLADGVKYAEIFLRTNLMGEAKMEEGEEPSERENIFFVKRNFAGRQSRKLP
jgi:hypothetical protein